MSDGPEIREGMAVVGSDGQHVGTVDKLERGVIKLARGDDPGGAGEHRAVPLGLVASAEGGQVRLTLAGQQARALVAGALDPSEVVEDGTVPVGGDGDAAEGAAAAGAGVPDDGGAPGVRGGAGTANRPHGAGTGAGGTAGGAGIADDPNMDPGTARRG